MTNKERTAHSKQLKDALTATWDPGPARAAQVTEVWDLFIGNLEEAFLSRSWDSDDESDEEDWLTCHEASWGVRDWIWWILEVPDEELIRHLVVGFTVALLRRPDLHNTIETFFLEHLLEDSRMEPFFADWSKYPELAGAHRECLAWARAHPRRQAT